MIDYILYFMNKNVYSVLPTVKIKCNRAYKNVCDLQPGEETEFGVLAKKIKPIIKLNFIQKFLIKRDNACIKITKDMLIPKTVFNRHVLTYGGRIIFCEA